MILGPNWNDCSACFGVLTGWLAGRCGDLVKLDCQVLTRTASQNWQTAPLSKIHQYISNGLCFTILIFKPQTLFHSCPQQTIPVSRFQHVSSIAIVLSKHRSRNCLYVKRCQGIHLLQIRQKLVPAACVCMIGTQGRSHVGIGSNGIHKGELCSLQIQNPHCYCAVEEWVVLRGQQEVATERKAGRSAAPKKQMWRKCPEG